MCEGASARGTVYKKEGSVRFGWVGLLPKRQADHMALASLHTQLHWFSFTLVCLPSGSSQSAFLPAFPRIPSSWFFPFCLSAGFSQSAFFLARPNLLSFRLSTTSLPSGSSQSAFPLARPNFLPGFSQSAFLLARPSQPAFKFFRVRLPFGSSQSALLLARPTQPSLWLLPMPSSWLFPANATQPSFLEDRPNVYKTTSLVFNAHSIIPPMQFRINTGEKLHSATIT